MTSTKLTKAQVETIVAAYESECACWVLRRKMDKSGWEGARLPPDEPISDDHLTVDLIGNELTAHADFDQFVWDRAIEAGRSALQQGGGDRHE